MIVTRVRGDLLDQPAEAVVNARNRNVVPWWLPTPREVGGAIKRRGGTAPFRELAKRGPMPLGSAAATGAGRLPFAAIIHVAGINFLWRSSERGVRDSVRNALMLAADRGFASVAVPLIGAGSGGGRADRCEAWILDELARCAADGVFDGEVRVVRYGKPGR